MTDSPTLKRLREEHPNRCMNPEIQNYVLAMESAIVKLESIIAQQRKDARDAELEFQREARDIAAEASWQERRPDYGEW